MKILFGNIAHVIDPEIRTMPEQVCLGTKIPHSILVNDLRSLELKFISETDNGIECECQCQINHGPEWNKEFSIPIQIPNWHLSDFWA